MLRTLCNFKYWRELKLCQIKQVLTETHLFIASRHVHFHLPSGSARYTDENTAEKTLHSGSDLITQNATQ
jgi:hypothetical protein